MKVDCRLHIPCCSFIKVYLLGFAYMNGCMLWKYCGSMAAFQTETWINYSCNAGGREYRTLISYQYKKLSVINGIKLQSDVQNRFPCRNMQNIREEKALECDTIAFRLPWFTSVVHFMHYTLCPCRQKDCLYRVTNVLYYLGILPMLSCRQFAWFTAHNLVKKPPYDRILFMATTLCCCIG